MSAKTAISLIVFFLVLLAICSASVSAAKSSPCVLSDFNTAEQTYTRTCDGTSYTLAIKGTALSAEKYGASQPPARTEAEMCSGWKQDGIEKQRKFCLKDNNWYWVNYAVSMSPKECEGNDLTGFSCQSNDVYCYKCNQFGFFKTSPEKYISCEASGYTDSYQCSGNTLQRQYANRGCSGGGCYENKVWNDYQDCSASGKVCQNNQCIVKECENGAIKCMNSSDLYKCSSNKWEKYLQCQYECNLEKNSCYSLKSEIALNGVDAIGLLGISLESNAEVIDEKINELIEDADICAIMSIVKGISNPYTSPPGSSSLASKLIVKYFKSAFFNNAGDALKKAIIYEKYKTDISPEFAQLEKNLQKMDDSILVGKTNDFIDDANHFFDKTKISLQDNSKKIDEIISIHDTSEAVMKTSMFLFDLALLLGTGGSGNLAKITLKLLLEEALKEALKDCAIPMPINAIFKQRLLEYFKLIAQDSLEKAYQINSTLNYINDKIKSGDSEFPSISVTENLDGTTTIKNNYKKPINVNLFSKGEIGISGYCGLDEVIKSSYLEPYSLLIGGTLQPNEERTYILNSEIPQMMSAIEKIKEVNAEEIKRICEQAKTRCVGTSSSVESKIVNKNYSIEIKYGEGEILIPKYKTYFMNTLFYPIPVYTCWQQPTTIPIVPAPETGGGSGGANTINKMNTEKIQNFEYKNGPSNAENNADSSQISQNDLSGTASITGNVVKTTASKTETKGSEIEKISSSLKSLLNNPHSKLYAGTALFIISITGLLLFAGAKRSEIKKFFAKQRKRDKKKTYRRKKAVIGKSK